ncbi:unnamed protein product [Arctogadus glacialis]
MPRPSRASAAAKLRWKKRILPLSTVDTVDCVGASASAQRPSLTPDFSEAHLPGQQLLIQLLSDRARLCGLLSVAVGTDNGEVIRRLSKV